MIVYKTPSKGHINHLVQNVFSRYPHGPQQPFSAVKVPKRSLTMFNFVTQFFWESRRKQLYRYLLQLFITLKETPFYGADPHEEQKQHIDALRPHLVNLKAKEIWFLIQNHEQREVYGKYFEEAQSVSFFEFFFQSAFIPSLSGEVLKEIYLLIGLSKLTEKKDFLKKLFDTLSCYQPKEMIEALYRDPFLSKEENAKLIEIMIPYLRNAQIRFCEFLIPDSLKKLALKKLYPCEIVDLLSGESNVERVRLLKALILPFCHQWWSSFSREEVVKVINFIQKCPC